ncbi:MAG: FG-GAP-like repeat-containing protein, partial [Candidatus Marinimicrobia bacterium]|nr:FG-GAP-like repeat-containing protein [Candidatus Neomarinimicrobiota bacterium]
EGDGDIEIVFCSKDQKCYILNGDGSVQAEYSANGFLMTTPALRDLDGDGDLEIIFGGFAKYLYVIHHDGTDFGSFPLYVDESIMMAPAVGDIDNDGSDEIVVGTWSNNVWAFDLDGTVVSGFPYSAGNKINSDPALADLDGDGTLEILVGSDDNYLYSINSDGSERFSVYSSGDVRGSPTIEDIDNDGDLEIFYGSNVKKVFGIDHEGNALSGWPQESTSTFKSAPVFADLTGSGYPLVIASNSGGNLFAWDLGGNIMGNFPINLGGTVEGSLSVNDIDGDGDLEISVGASSSLAMIDIKTEGGSGDYWSMYRFNSTRSGNRSDFEMGVEDNYPMLPTQFVVYQNYPNPFNPSTRIRYDLPEQSFVTITIHDLLGRNVRTLVKELQDAGHQSVVWDGKNEDGFSLSTGIYFFQVHIPDGNLRTKKMMLLK